MNSRYYYFLLIGVGVVFILIGAFSLPENIFRGNENVAGVPPDSSRQFSPSPSAIPFSNFFQRLGSKESSNASFSQADKTELPKLKVGKSEVENFSSRSINFVSNPADLSPPVVPISKKAQEARKTMIEASGVFSGIQTTAAPKIYFSGYHEQYGINAPAKIIWSVIGEKSSSTIEKTLLYWSNNSVSDPQPTKYQFFSENYQGKTPQNFEYLPELEPGIYYFRAFAAVDGKNYWSDEIKIGVLAQ